MNYLSFDVGIKNLAYCELTPDKNIVQWGIINLNDTPLCSMHLKKKCEKQASYSLTQNDNISYYCSLHVKHKTLNKKAKKKKLNTKYDILKLSKICISKLRNLDLSNIKYILIENQPALKNPVMKSIQMIIYTFFIIEGIMKETSNIEFVHLVNARNKLKVYKGPKIECNKKNKYAKNKYLSIEYTKYMVNNEKEEFKILFNNSKKKDDLSDAYLQGMYWIEK